MLENYLINYDVELNKLITKLTIILFGKKYY